MYPEALRANPPPRYLQSEVGSYPASLGRTHSISTEGLRRSRWVLGRMVSVGSGVRWGRPLEPASSRASRKTGLPQSIMRSRYLRSPGGPLGALEGPLERPDAQGQSEVSERGSRKSWSGLGLNPKPLLLGGKYVIKTKVLGIGRFLMK